LALSDSMVPLRVDHRSGPLDLSEDRRTGLKLTPSVSHLNRALDLRSDGREKDRGRAHREKVDGEGLAALEIKARWFRSSSMAMVYMTVFRELRRARKRDWRP
jgi:hypothetical protein